MAPLEQVRHIAGRVQRALQHTVERLLHGRRRRAAIRRLTSIWARGGDGGPGAGVTGPILVVCHGNIYRSAYAATVLRRRLGSLLDGEVIQGGFFGPGRPATVQAQETAARRGIDLSQHESRLVRESDVRSATLIVVMEQPHARRIVREFGARSERVVILGDLDPGPIEARGIRDPYGADPEVVAHTYDRIERCLEVLVETMGGVDARGPLDG